MPHADRDLPIYKQIPTIESLNISTQRKTRVIEALQHKQLNIFDFRNLNAFN